MQKIYRDEDKTIIGIACVNKPVQYYFIDLSFFFKFENTFQIDLPKIKQQYKVLHKEDLIDAVKGETSGDYEKIFVELLNRK